ncbi:NADH-ubiquinone oxidoreductase subunit [Gigaspora margarita]|uniref:NADH-ubiquinone oxidoreductase subunit n=1 Tax=Gigaspora margarita TaxID=4874 RepID=A0A8H3WTW5_GIGMA|nr:NADH-ubiquinone oxidoreductase subunit [Gigaspora margarita]
MMFRYLKSANSFRPLIPYVFKTPSLTITSRPLTSVANNSQNSNGKEGFGTKAWRNTLLVCLAGFAWYHLDRYLTKNGELKHPITEIIESLMTPDSEWRRINVHNAKTANIIANDRLLFGEAKRPPIHRLMHPDCFERTSPFLIEPGTDVDLSDLVIKTDHD